MQVKMPLSRKKVTDSVHMSLQLQLTARAANPTESEYSARDALEFKGELKKNL
jgi:hypothetical protein